MRLASAGGDAAAADTPAGMPAPDRGSPGDRRSPANGASRAVALARAGAVLGAVVALDQVTKATVVAGLEPGERLRLIPGVALVNVRNTGVAFGALTGGGPLIIGLVAAALLLLTGYFARRASLPLLWLPIGMLLGGALGNVADRFREGAVIDFIDPVAWPAFNLADTAIVLGLAGIVYAVEVLPGRREASDPEP